MREIKFRAWDKVEKVMYVPTDLFLCTDGKTWAIDQDGRYGKSHHQNAEDVALMQFTGVKDKNGAEIYEGDIVRIGSFVPQVWQVGFDRGGFCFFNEGDTFYNDIKYCEDGEIIGNIYENPELLK